MNNTNSVIKEGSFFDGLYDEGDGIFSFKVKTVYWAEIVKKRGIYHAIIKCRNGKIVFHSKAYRNKAQCRNMLKTFTLLTNMEFRNDIS